MGRRADQEGANWSSTCLRFVDGLVGSTKFMRWMELITTWACEPTVGLAIRRTSYSLVALRASSTGC